MATLAGLPADVARPAYDRDAVTCGVVHLGIGAFHRAHQAMIFEAALNSGDLRWGITAASLRSPAVRDQMAPQDGLYTCLVRDGAEERPQVVGAVREVLVAPEDPAALVAALARPETHIVTLTVTEKGYRLDPATGALLDSDPEVAADLADLSAPRTAPGFLVAGLAARRASGAGPLTIVSCDNIPRNGHRLQAAVLAMADAHDHKLADWIEAEIAFPETMIDRIVPATTEADIAALAARLGVEDRAMVKTEPFLQWVVEDRFSGPRPDFVALGVQLTADVARWEQAKLRLLNGAHSSIAYLGGIAGIDYVHQVTGRPAMRRFVEALWDEAQTTLSPPRELDVAAYRRELMARFDNSALQHSTRQIAMDGSQKLPQRLLATIAARIDQGRCIDRLALGVAGWMRWQFGRDEAGNAFTVDDPLAGETARRLAGLDNAEAMVRALLGIAGIFPAELQHQPALVAALTRSLDALLVHGAMAAVEMLDHRTPEKIGVTAG
jgi:fructuronate reductase